jgi:hypothetical protein
MASLTLAIVKQTLAQNGGQSLPESSLIGRCETPKFLEHESWIDGGEDRLEYGWLEQPRALPVLNLHLADGEGRGLLTRDGHDKEIRACPMVGGAADYHRGSAFNS